MSENTIKTTQKHGNVCKNENKSLRTYQCIINTMSENTIKTIQRHVYTHTYIGTHTKENPHCALIHSRYQVCEENSGVKLPTLTVRGDLSIHPAYGAAPLWLSQRYGYTHHGYTMHIQRKAAHDGIFKYNDFVFGGPAILR